MAIKSDHWIRQMAREDQLIVPFVDHQETEPGCISYGLGSYSYDMRLADEIYLTNTDPYRGYTDPKRRHNDTYIAYTAEDYFDLPAYSFILGHSVEKFRIPYDCLGMFFGKSTYMRCGIVYSAGLVQPGFVGQIVIELANTTPVPVRVYVNEGIAQIVFVQNEQCAISYTGQFYGQTGIRLSGEPRKEQ